MVVNEVNTAINQKKAVFTVFLLLFGLTSPAQKLSTAEWQSILNSKEFLIGRGEGNSIEEARQYALKDLAEHISTRVKSQFDYVAKENSNDKGRSAEEKMSQIIKSYSAVTLNNVSEYIEKSKPPFVVYRYMKNKELRDMFKR